MDSKGDVHRKLPDLAHEIGDFLQLFPEKRIKLRGWMVLLEKHKFLKIGGFTCFQTHVWCRGSDPMYSCMFCWDSKWQSFIKVCNLGIQRNYEKIQYFEWPTLWHLILRLFFWHHMWHMFGHSIWRSIWHSISHSIWNFSGILSDMCSGPSPTASLKSSFLLRKITTKSPPASCSSSVLTSVQDLGIFHRDLAIWRGGFMFHQDGDVTGFHRIKSMNI